MTKKIAIILFILLSGHAAAQSSLSCTPGTTNLMDRAEGFAEPSGDILLNCVNGTPGATINSNITVSYNVPVTNRLVNGAPDAVITIDTGSGPVQAAVTPTLLSPNLLAFNGVNLVVPPSGAALIRISNVRLNVNYAGAGRTITANLSTTLPLSSATVTVASPLNGILATYSSTESLAPDRCCPLPSTSTI